MYGIKEEIKINENKDLPTKEEIEAFALTTTAQNTHDFVVLWNKNNIKKIQGNDVENILINFKAKALNAKGFIERKEPLPEDLKIFEGKINIKSEE